MVYAPRLLFSMKKVEGHLVVMAARDIRPTDAASRRIHHTQSPVGHMFGYAPVARLPPDEAPSPGALLS